ncbi:hypothetical protein H0I23_07160 [Cellulophaga sp. HaHaR_3_176]|uniref:hypothetical protein n=1 Tax=Cellulophaga sp. HaHaR_3_176 TaxID=1942464 RepID=UPI001C1F5E26|nr:hypothetical protein [Cellulophaga sp. HaHaR_3_176]QWX85412.1 hypothetical protein H0I23_07160 [Cellulophaga sp. HaHaR_3_176]
MKKKLHILVLLFFCFCSCKTEKTKLKSESSEKKEKISKKENYKACLDEVFFNNVRLGNYGHIIKITPDTLKPKNNMDYNLLLIRDKKMSDSGNLKLNDTIINMLINKNTIKKSYKQNKKDTINIDNFHLLTANYYYSRASESHFSVLMYSIKDSLFCNVGYHFDYHNGKYRFSIYKEKETKIKAIEKYNNFKCN